MRRRRDKARDLRARAAATPPRLAGDLGGLEAAKRHNHATRGHVARRGVEAASILHHSSVLHTRRLRFCFSVLFAYDRVVADLVSTGQTEKL